MSKCAHFKALSREPSITVISSNFLTTTGNAVTYTLSLHDALPISLRAKCDRRARTGESGNSRSSSATRSEEHTSELQSHSDIVCRLLLEKKKSGYRHAGLMPHTPLHISKQRHRHSKDHESQKHLYP